MTEKLRGKCMVEGCGRNAYAIGLCHRCYVRMAYWNKKSLKQKLSRIRQIQMWENSLEMQMGNVRGLKQHRNKVANE